MCIGHHIQAFCVCAKSEKQLDTKSFVINWTVIIVVAWLGYDLK